MIGSEFYKGQGLGNQLWIYAVVRSLAERKGFEYGFLGTANFKGSGFLDLDFGISSSKGTANQPTHRIPKGYSHYCSERRLTHWDSGADITPVDQAILNIQDGTFIDGALQAEAYLEGYRQQIAEWFKVSKIQENKCVISLRGGEYRGLSEVFLPKQYYDNAMEYIRSIDPNVQFEVVTDDLGLAKEYFPGLEATSSGGVKIFLGRYYSSPKSSLIGRDFLALQSAKYLILSNSSFSWWGAYSNTHVSKVVAPKYWARFNISDGYWSQGDSLTSGWTWLDRFGSFSEYSQCVDELTTYKKNTDFFS